MANPINQILDDIVNEVVEAKFPSWPDDPFHALAVISEEFGELNQAVLQHVYEPKKKVEHDDIRDEAIQLAAMAVRQLAAMAVRFVMSLDSHDYNFENGNQHRQ